MPPFLRCCLSLLSFGLLTSCVPMGHPEQPIPTALVPASGKAERLLVVLPGRGDDLAGLRKSGIVAIIQQTWPRTDVQLTGLTMGYYRAGNAIQRLHDEVMLPARRRGYREVLLLGISLGGMGSLLYDRQYPGDVDGMVLLAPYLGDAAIHHEIVANGGLAHWQAGAAEDIRADNFQRQLWRHLQTWATKPQWTRNVWLGFGDHDRLRSGIDLLAPMLPLDHVLILPGGHRWKVWKPAARHLLQRIVHARSNP